jgi:hypothetical protein
VPVNRSRKHSPAARLAGLAVAGIGLSHFTSPQLFDGITKQAFPRNSRQHLYINGGIETALSQTANQNLYFLELQERMSAESRNYSAISNVLKARHDTVKNAIGNIR